MPELTGDVYNSFTLKLLRNASTHGASGCAATQDHQQVQGSKQQSRKQCQHNPNKVTATGQTSFNSKCIPAARSAATHNHTHHLTLKDSINLLAFTITTSSLMSTYVI